MFGFAFAIRKRFAILSMASPRYLTHSFRFANNGISVNYRIILLNDHLSWNAGRQFSLSTFFPLSPFRFVSEANGESTCRSRVCTQNIVGESFVSLLLLLISVQVFWMFANRTPSTQYTRCISSKSKKKTYVSKYIPRFAIFVQHFLPIDSQIKFHPVAAVRPFLEWRLVCNYATEESRTWLRKWANSIQRFLKCCSYLHSESYQYQATPNIF